jgi:hypothetical protein
MQERSLRAPSGKTPAVWEHDRSGPTGPPSMR